MPEGAINAAQCRGIRGATTVEQDSAGAILQATSELLARVLEENGAAVEDLASAFFTVTPDLTAAFPAAAARQMGWQQVALMDAQEIPVPGSLPRCVRVLIHWNTPKSQSEIHHVYLRGAASLRPDLVPDCDPARAVNSEGPEQHGDLVPDCDPARAKDSGAKVG